MRSGFVVAGLVVLTGLPWGAAEAAGRDRRAVDAEVRDVLSVIGPLVEALGATEARTQDAPRLLEEALRTGRTDSAAWASIVRWVLSEKEERVAAGLAQALTAVPPPADGPDAARWNATARAVIGSFAAVLEDARHFRRQDGDALMHQLVGVAAPAVVAALSEADPAARESVLAAVQALAPSAKDMVGSLSEGLRHPEPAVRLGAATALGALGPSAGAAAAPLRRLLDDPDAGVREAAARALARIAPQ
jgi:hypothetical protein